MCCQLLDDGALLAVRRRSESMTATLPPAVPMPLSIRCAASVAGIRQNALLRRYRRTEMLPQFAGESLFYRLACGVKAAPAAAALWRRAERAGPAVSSEARLAAYGDSAGSPGHRLPLIAEGKFDRRC